MGTITVKYRSKKQLSTLKKVLSALDFEIEEKFENPSPSGDKWFENSKNLEMIERGLEDSRNGRKRILTIEEQKQLLSV